MYRSSNLPLLSKCLGGKFKTAFFVFFCLGFNFSTLASGPAPELKQTPQSSEVSQAKKLLAEMIAGDAVIEVKLFEEVTWRNGALGCPKPDGIYTQALIKGYRIILIAENREYAFHGRENGQAIYCESPSATIK